MNDTRGAVDLKLLDEPERHDVALEVGVAHDPQCVEHARLVNLHMVKNIVHSAIVPEPSPNRGVMIVLAYLWPLALVPLLLDKSDSEVQWHAKHGIVLMVAELVLLFGYIMMTSIVSLATFGLGCALSLLLVFGWIAVLVRPHRRHRERDQRRAG